MSFKHRLNLFLIKVSNKLPLWLFRFNNGFLYFSNLPKLDSRANSNFFIDEVNKGDIEEISKLTGFTCSQLKARIDAGDIGMVSRSVDSNKIVTILLAHFGNTFIRGFNLKLNIPQSSVYVYWAFSDPKVRLTCIFNSSFKKLVNKLSEEGVNEFYALVETCNRKAKRFHEKINFKKVKSILYIKVLFFCITIQKDLILNKIHVKINLLKVKNIDII